MDRVEITVVLNMLLCCASSDIGIGVNMQSSNGNKNNNTIHYYHTNKKNY